MLKHLSGSMLKYDIKTYGMRDYLIFSSATHYDWKYGFIKTVIIKTSAKGTDYRSVYDLRMKLLQLQYPLVKYVDVTNGMLTIKYISSDNAPKNALTPLLDMINKSLENCFPNCCINCGSLITDKKSSFTDASLFGIYTYCQDCQHIFYERKRSVLKKTFSAAVESFIVSEAIALICFISSQMLRLVCLISALSLVPIYRYFSDGSGRFSFIPLILCNTFIFASICFLSGYSPVQTVLCFFVAESIFIFSWYYHVKNALL